MGRGYAEGSAIDERRAALDRGDNDPTTPLDLGRVGVFGSTEDEAEQHFIGWLGEVDPDELFASGAAWGIKTVRLRG